MTLHLKTVSLSYLNTYKSWVISTVFDALSNIHILTLVKPLKFIIHRIEKVVDALIVIALKIIS